MDVDISSIYSMMVMSGYLTAEPNDYDYDLRIPNKEMYGVFASFMSIPLGSNVADYISKFTKALLSNDTSTMETSLYYLINKTMGFRLLDHEHTYQAFIATFSLNLSGIYEVTAEMESGNGYYDILMKCIRGNYPHVIFELKRCRDNDSSAEVMAERALEQIRNKDYFHGLKGDVILYGTAFDSKKPTIRFEVLRL